MLGLDSHVLALLLDALASILTDGGVFDGLADTDARRVGGTLTWDTLLCHPVPSAEDVAVRAAHSLTDLISNV